MKVKHGIHQRAAAGETFYECFWLGEKVTEEDFNDRLAGMTASAGKDLDLFIQGFDAKKSLNAGQKTLSELHALEEVAKLPLCEACRKLIGEIG
jgi:hypothetical protein